MNKYLLIANLSAEIQAQAARIKKFAEAEEGRWIEDEVERIEESMKELKSLLDELKNETY